MQRFDLWRLLDQKFATLLRMRHLLCNIACVRRHEQNTKVPGVTNPLDGTSRIVRSGAGMFHYYAKLVPMIYETQGKQIFTNLSARWTKLDVETVVV